MKFKIQLLSILLIVGVVGCQPQAPTTQPVDQLTQDTRACEAGYATLQTAIDAATTAYSNHLIVAKDFHNATLVAAAAKSAMDSAYQVRGQAAFAQQQAAAQTILSALQTYATIAAPQPTTKR
jgi:hypothetical protein